MSETTDAPAGAGAAVPVAPATFEDLLAAFEQLQARDAEQMKLLKGLAGQVLHMEQEMERLRGELPAMVNEALAGETRVFAQKIGELRAELGPAPAARR